MRCCARNFLLLFLTSAVPHAAFSAEGSNLFELHDHFSEIRSKIVGSPKDKHVAVWEEYYRSNNSLMLDIQEASKIKEQADIVFIGKIQNRAKELPQLLKGSEITLEHLKTVLTSSLIKLNSLVPFGQPIDVHLVLHPHPFNGKEFLLGDKPSFAFNLSYPNFGDKTDLSVLVAHEGFHVLHLREVGRSLLDTAEGTVLREGLAVYVTKKIFPKSSDQQLLFFTPEEYKRCLSNTKPLRLKLIESIDRGFDETNKLFFSSKPGDDFYPPRCGYYIGYKMVEQLLSKHSLGELMKMPYVKYAPLVKSSLQNL